MSLKAKWEAYEEALKNTAECLPALNAGLKELEGLLHCPDCCTQGGFSYDDIDLWSRLRSLTLVKGAEFPPKVLAYLTDLEAKGDVPLYFTMQV
jgi:glutaredoxin 2